MDDSSRSSSSLSSCSSSFSRKSYIRPRHIRRLAAKQLDNLFHGKIGSSINNLVHNRHHKPERIHTYTTEPKKQWSDALRSHEAGDASSATNLDDEEEEFIFKIRDGVLQRKRAFSSSSSSSTPKTSLRNQKETIFCNKGRKVMRSKSGSWYSEDIRSITLTWWEAVKLVAAFIYAMALLLFLLVAKGHKKLLKHRETRTVPLRQQIPNNIQVH